MKVGVENYWRFNGIKTPSMKARTKVLATCESKGEDASEL